MAYFGTYLLKCGALKRSEIEDALQARVVYGGRLGTNLLELGYLSLDDLARYLSEYTGAPLAPTQRLSNPHPKALRAIPLALARRFKALAFDLQADTLHVAMLDPADTAQVEKIAEATGCRVKSFAVPEVLLHTLLEQHLGVAPERRFANLAKTLGAREALRRADRARQQAETPAPEQPAPKAVPAIDAVPTPLA
ncbi:MAG TPA: hypothetical protein VIY27_00950, partial [Myxococcota bacterium]